MSRLRVVVFGTSFGRIVHVEGFRRHPGFEVVGIAGSDAERTRRVAEQAGIPHADHDWARLLAAQKPDLVSVVAPVFLHHPMALAAFDSGAHVLCEKPTAMDRGQALEMRDRARARGRVYAINHEFREFPARRHAVGLVRAGAIGTPRRAEILGRYPLWTRPESRAMTWLADRARGGGVLGALGSHHTDCLRTLLGEPASVQASVRVQQPLRGPTPDDPRTGTATADDACTLSYAFAGGATALVDLDATAPYRWERFEVHGSEATLRWDETGYRLWRIEPKREPEELSIPEDLRLAPRDGDPALLAPFGALIGRLHDAIGGGAAMAPDGDDALRVQCALDAARESSVLDRRVEIVAPPD